MTVNMLIQIDKLVQLLESPVFTCTPLLSISTSRILIGNRSSSPTPRTGEISLSLQMPLRRPDALTTKFRLRRAEKPS